MRKRLDNPKGHFVYNLYNKDNELLYIGYTGSLISRLGQHRRVIYFDYVEYEEFSNKYEAMRYEAQQILKYKPPHNKIRQITLDTIKDWEDKMKIIRKIK